MDGDEVYNAIVSAVDKPGVAVLGSEIAKGLGISEDSFWEYANQLKRMGRIGMTTNCVYLR